MGMADKPSRKLPAKDELDKDHSKSISSHPLMPHAPHSTRSPDPRLSAAVAHGQVDPVREGIRDIRRERPQRPWRPIRPAQG